MPVQPLASHVLSRGLLVSMTSLREAAAWKPTVTKLDECTGAPCATLSAGPPGARLPSLPSAAVPKNTKVLRLGIAGNSLAIPWLKWACRRNAEVIAAPLGRRVEVVDRAHEIDDLVAVTRTRVSTAAEHPVGIRRARVRADFPRRARWHVLVVRVGIDVVEVQHGCAAAPDREDRLVGPAEFLDELEGVGLGVGDRHRIVGIA